ncbi:MAG TPA: hypothetical protein PKW08_09900 [Flavobacteriaceae bacterium]|nr:hypothetical protein [Flavobacteriaceae bacterium]MCB9213108.1 hypothetical protein [Alteromonas sp.]HPF11014.1 hypothetical protein [Flavobacteriaceae bacterium]HQU21887.1 hypothetical protein [Flavobacteriaceae bacterium]HQU64137.1 hypothetical protein [Flavobacteriaceae bacterium]
MKSILKGIALSSLSLLAFWNVSCNKDDNSNNNDEVEFSAEDTALVARADNIVEGSQNVVEGGYVKTEEPTRTDNNIFPPDCATFIITGGGNNGGTITIDFGESCTLLTGAIVSGKINMSYGPIVSGQRNITYNYENFTYNGNGVAGGGTIIRELENNQGNPQSTVNESITITFTGTTVTGTRTGQRVAEWVQGVGSGNWQDNVFHIEGNWQTNLSNGFERTGVVTQTLVRKMSCLYLVSGRIEVSQQGLTGTLDFGDGTCDALATIIFNGHEYPVILGL